MPSVNTTLSNCYIPLPATKPPSQIDPCRRPDGSGSGSGSGNKSNKPRIRNAKTLRRLCIDRHILSSSTGSSLIEIGHTKVLCSVHGPRPISSSSSGASNAKGGDDMDSGILNCQIRYAPHFGIRPTSKVMMSHTNLDGYSGGAPLNSTATTPHEIELSSRLQDAIAPSLPLGLLKKNVVDVFVMVLQEDGSAFTSTFNASVIAASLALADAGVEVYDLVSCFSVAVVPNAVCGFSSDVDINANTGGQEFGNEEDGGGISKVDPNFRLLADPDEEELAITNSGTKGQGGIVTVAMMKNWKEVVFWDQAGRLPSAVAQEAAEMCREGCVIMHRFMRQALIGKQHIATR